MTAKTQIVWLGIDIGSTHSKALFLNSDRQPIAHASVTTPTYSYTGPDGASRCEVDLAEVMQVVVDLVGQLRNSCPGAAVTAIGVTGQMHGLGLVDANGAPLGRFITWQDQRTLAAEGDDPSAIRTLAEHLGDRTPSGARLRPGMTGPLLVWVTRAGLASREAHATTLPDSVAAALTGTPIVTDPTNATATGVFDPETLRWCNDVLDRVGVSPALLPTVVPTGSVAGHLRKPWSDRMGLPAGIPVLVGLGDFQSAVHAMNPRVGDLVVNVGTGAQVCMRATRTGAVPGYEARPAADAGYLICASGLRGGSVLATFDNDSQRESLLDDLAREYADEGRAIVRALKIEMECVIAGGGTLRHNARLRQCLARHLKRTVDLCAYEHEACAGAALLARTAVEDRKPG